MYAYHAYANRSPIFTYTFDDPSRQDSTCAKDRPPSFRLLILLNPEIPAVLPRFAFAATASKAVNSYSAYSVSDKLTNASFISYSMQDKVSRIITFSEYITEFVDRSSY